MRTREAQEPQEGTGDRGSRTPSARPYEDGCRAGDPLASSFQIYSIRLFRKQTLLNTLCLYFPPSIPLPFDIPTPPQPTAPSPVFEGTSVSLVLAKPMAKRGLQDFLPGRTGPSEDPNSGGLSPRVQLAWLAWSRTTADSVNCESFPGVLINLAPPPPL